MANQPPQLSALLRQETFPSTTESAATRKLKSLQLQMLRIQQGIWQHRRRTIIVFEGFDASGKGGTIRRLLANLDPRGVRVHAIGPPSRRDQSIHYLFRFWKRLPAPGSICVFDRSWYGRLLVERVEGLVSERRLNDAYNEITQFEKLLTDDGIDVVKIFLAIHPDEQLRRFEDRIHNPDKQWKLQTSDLRAHQKWSEYVEAADDALRLTHTKSAPWNLIPADSKPFAHLQVLEKITAALEHHAVSEKDKVKNTEASKKLMSELKRLKKLSK